MRSDETGLSHATRDPTAARTGSREPDLDGIKSKVLSLTSYLATSRRRDARQGREEGGRLDVMTDANSGKVKRIRRDQGVRIAACPGGRPNTDPIPAHVEILPPSETERVRRSIGSE